MKRIVVLGAAAAVVLGQACANGGGDNGATSGFDVLPSTQAGSTEAGAGSNSSRPGGMGGGGSGSGSGDVTSQAARGGTPAAGKDSAGMGGREMMSSAGAGAGAGAGGTESMLGSAGSPSIGSKSPTIPMVEGECPEFRSGTITFMGLSGIAVSAGPKAAGPTAPMVFYWHGTGSFAGEYAGGAAPVNAGVVQEGGILISFQGSTGGDLLSGTYVFGAGDFKLTDQLVACAVRDHNVDPRRIFTTGCSAGGLFAAAMATQRSSYIAAAAPNSGGWTFPLQFQNDHIPALMTMHGAPGGDVVVVDFSETSMTADTAFKGKGGFVINCNHGGVHCGAGAGLYTGVWQFFKAHPYGVDPLPWKDGLPSGFPDSCKLF